MGYCHIVGVEVIKRRETFGQQLCNEKVRAGRQDCSSGLGVMQFQAHQPYLTQNVAPDQEILQTRRLNLVWWYIFCSHSQYVHTH